jgi:hypothetical protein
MQNVGLRYNDICRSSIKITFQPMRAPAPTSSHSPDRGLSLMHSRDATQNLPVKHNDKLEVILFMDHAPAPCAILQPRANRNAQSWIKPWRHLTTHTCTVLWIGTLPYAFLGSISTVTHTLAHRSCVSTSPA